MEDRNWIEQVFLKALLDHDPTLGKIGNNKELLKELLDEFYPIVFKEFRKDFKKNLKKNYSDLNKAKYDFKKRLYKRWRRPLELLENFIGYNIECGEIISNSYLSDKKHFNDVKFKVLIQLHARSCQIANEIHELLKGGFADGAMARWRTLYEISIYANFLVDKPFELAQKYLDHYFIDNASEAREYQKNYKLLGFDPLSNEEIKENENLRNELILKYGKDFANPHGWAAEYLPKGKCHFAGIEATIDFSHFRSFYKMANNKVHAGSKGLLSRLGLINQKTIMLAGPSNYGLADPGQLTAISLLHTFSTLTEFEGYMENALFLDISEDLVSEISRLFFKVQLEIENEEIN